MSVAPSREVFRSRFNNVISVVIWSLCAIFAGSLFLVPAGIHLV